MIREKVKALWELCFRDSDEAVDLYFRTRYTSDANMVITSGEEVIATLQLLPYTLTYYGKDLAVGHVSGACTHPEFQGRGVMRLLLSQAFTRMLHQDKLLSTLIPAEPWQFSYFSEMGYAPVFCTSERTFSCPMTDQSPEQPTTLLLETADTFDKEVWTFLCDKQQTRTCCMLHTADDWQLVLTALTADGGHVYTLRQDGQLTALAVTVPSEQDATHPCIVELLSDTPDQADTLLQALCRHLHLTTLQLLLPADNEDGDRRPMGMARIINAKAMLLRFAAAHPDVEENIELTDEQLTTNNGYYYVVNGRCMHSAQRLPGRHRKLNISALTQFVLEASHPCLSLMPAR